MTFPTSVDPSPIIESVIELKFNPKVPDDAIFGIVYKSFSSEFPNVTQLPLSQIPNEIRQIDPELRHKPNYQLSNEKMSLQTGPGVIVLASPHKYVGWKVLSKQAFNIIDKITSVNIVEDFSRLGIRYINFFEKKNIFDDIFLTVTSMKAPRPEPLTNKGVSLKLVLPKPPFTLNIRIKNDAILIRNKGNIPGSIIDIDCFIKKNGESIDPKKLKELIEEGHNHIKDTFFTDLLKPEFIKSLNPKY